MKLKPLNRQVWLTEVELEGYNLRGAAIIEEDSAVIIDTLSHPDDIKPLRPLIEGKELTIVYTHADWDHIYGTAGLPCQNISIVGHCACLERFGTDVPITLKNKQAAEPGKYDGVKLITPTITFEDDYLILAGALTLTLHHLPGHTKDSIVAFLPQHGILFMGDTVETPFPCLEYASPLTEWIRHLNYWNRHRSVRYVIPSHGDIGGIKIIEENIIYLRHLLNGDEVVLPNNLPAFYQEAHKENIHFARGAL